MAQVLPPILQPSTSITMLHTSSDAFQNSPAPQSHHQQPRAAQMPRNQAYNGQTGTTGYRTVSSAPIAPYAFSSTPQLRQDNRSVSTPPPHAQQQLSGGRLGHPSHPSSSSDSTTSTSGSSNRSTAGPQFASKDDSVLNTHDNRKSIVDGATASPISFSTSVPDLSSSLQDAPVKPSPDRYRRGARRSDSSNSITASSSTPTPTQQSPPFSALVGSAPSKAMAALSSAVDDLEPPTRSGHSRSSSVDDMQMPRQGLADPAKRYRRRSLSGLDANAQAAKFDSSIAPSSTPMDSSTKRPSSRQGSRPTSSHGHERKGSTGSISSVSSARPSSRPNSSHQRPSQANTSTSPQKGSSEAARRTIPPSPLSNPISPTEPPKQANSSPSLAVQQLSALNGKEAGRGMKSRLRRAFSFGSAAELRRASAENSMSAERAKLRKDKYESEQEAEQAAIVAKQEAAGIGAGIYSGQGGFTGSTDNVSISSTASSASIMLRKMGSGMKKGGRSIKGLFRPKSVIGVPAADGPVARASVGQVSMVSVEAERQKVNVNADPHDQNGGGTGYPRLERNSIDAGRTAAEAAVSSGLTANDPWSRKSIIGGDKERAEVLSSMKKGILKRAGTGSDTSSNPPRPADAHHANDTPKSSAPSTPNDDSIRIVPAPLNADDYFARSPRLPNASTRSLPTTPHGSMRNISFSPRIQFHDAWSASDYDRRGDIATCNRLTPMLAQQIKEELNTFKMEMEVHELSKPHTHFF